VLARHRAPGERGRGSGLGLTQQARSARHNPGQKSLVSALRFGEMEMQNPPMPLSLTWLEVTDDAIKIGLGATIAGVFAWAVARYGSKSAIEKMRFERRTKILSDAAQTYEGYFQVFIRFKASACALSAALAPLVRDQNLPAWAQGAAMEPFAAETNSLFSQLNAKLQDILTAQSQLMLLGENRCEQAGSALAQAIAAGLKLLKWNGKTCDTSHSDEISAAVSLARDTFYKEMRLAFDRD